MPSESLFHATVTPAFVLCVFQGLLPPLGECRPRKDANRETNGLRFFVSDWIFSEELGQYCNCLFVVHVDDYGTSAHLLKLARVACQHRVTL